MLMEHTERATEADVFDLRIGLDENAVSSEAKHFFDIAGYLVVKDLLTPNQVARAREVLGRLEGEVKEGPFGGEFLHIIEAGGVPEDAMALEAVLNPVRQFIWGQQYRLIGSRALLREAGVNSRLTQGGRADKRGYTRYRSFHNGQFRCLLITCLIALEDAVDGDGAFCVVPASHKANLPHPYGNTELDAVPPLIELPLRVGSGVLFTESLSHAFKAPIHHRHHWMSYQYGPSYMVNWPGCEPSATLLERIGNDPAKAHLLLPPYYHPEGSQKKESSESQPQ
jgi:hypothetical protein